MQRDNDRDRAIERVLRLSLSTGAPADDRPCVDGETLAAWTEGHLPAASVEAVERHLSSCARCQQVLAMLAQTAPASIAQIPLWRRWRLQWLVPIATAATVAAIWVATPQEERAAYMGYTEPPSPPSEGSSRVSEAAPPRPQTVPPATGTASDRQLKRDADSPSANQVKDAPARPTAAPPQPPLEPPAALRAREESQRRDGSAFGDLQKTQPPAAAAETDDARRREAAGQRAPEALQETVVVQGASRPAQTAPPSQGQPTGRSTQGELRAFTAQQIGAAGEIVSPNPANRWRIIGGRQVQRTTNSGARWDAATLPATALLTGGSSPAPSVCWIVGRSGAIYLTIDGSRFVRIAFPEPIDLVSVTATDDQRATVTAADGRTFTTADGGMTWTAARP